MMRVAQTEVLAGRSCQWMEGTFFGWWVGHGEVRVSFVMR